MLTHIYFVLWHPQSFPLPLSMGPCTAGQGQRYRVRCRYGDHRGQVTSHGPLDRQKLGRACPVTFSWWLASTYELKIQTLTCCLIGLHLIPPYCLLPFPLHLNSPFVSHTNYSSFLCLSFSFQITLLECFCPPSIQKTQLRSFLLLQIILFFPFLGHSTQLTPRHLYFWRSFIQHLII